MSEKIVGYVGDSISNILEQKICRKGILLCNNGEDALESILQNKPSFIIPDMYLPRLNGLTILKEIKRNDIKASVLCYCRKLRTVLGVKAIAAGARGLTDYSAGMSDFTYAITNVSGGRLVIPENSKQLIDSNDFILNPEKYRDIPIRQIKVMQRGFPTI